MDFGDHTINEWVTRLFAATGAEREAIIATLTDAADTMDRASLESLAGAVHREMSRLRTPRDVTEAIGPLSLRLARRVIERFGSLRPAIGDLQMHGISDIGVQHLVEIADIYRDRAALEETLQHCTAGQRAGLAVWWLVSETMNGGIEQFFTNSTGILTRDALDGCRLIGANEMVGVLTACIARFPDDIDLEDRDARCDAIDNLRDGLDEESDGPFGDLAYGDAADEAFVKMDEYVRANPHEFFEM